MDWVNFGLLLIDNVALYASILIVSIGLYYFIFRKFFISILDPATFALLYSVFGFSVVWFLYFTKSIELKYLISYLLTQCAFWLGLFTFKTLKKTDITNSYQITVLENQPLFEKVFFLITSLSYIFIQLFSYKVTGIPLLLGNHIDIYSNSGGWGILGRILDTLKPCSIYMLTYFILNKTSAFLTYYKYFFLILVVIFFALSGSKGEFMALGFLIFCFLLLNAPSFQKQFKNINRLGLVLVVTGFFFALMTLFFQPGNGTNAEELVGAFLFRLISSGDTYYFAYPNQVIEHIDHSKPFLALFGDLFSTLRIIPRNQQPVILGVQLFRTFSTLDVTAGPNARHNVFGYVYFGLYGSIVFSYLIGSLLSFIRNKLFFKMRKNIIAQIIFVFLYLNVAGIETDPPMAFSNLENVMLMLPLFVIPAIMLYIFLSRKYYDTGLKVT